MIPQRSAIRCIAAHARQLPCGRASPPPRSPPAPSAAPSSSPATRYSPSGRASRACPSAASDRTRARSSASAPPTATAPHARADAASTRSHRPASHSAATPAPRPQTPLQKLRKLLQVAQVGLAAQRPQPALHAQMRHILAQQRRLTARCSSSSPPKPSTSILSPHAPQHQPPYPPRHVSPPRTLRNHRAHCVRCCFTLRYSAPSANSASKPLPLPPL